MRQSLLRGRPGGTLWEGARRAGPWPEFQLAVRREWRGLLSGKGTGLGAGQPGCTPCPKLCSLVRKIPRALVLPLYLLEWGKHSVGEWGRV